MAEIPVVITRAQQDDLDPLIQQIAGLALSYTAVDVLLAAYQLGRRHAAVTQPALLTDVCPACMQADLEPFGGKHRCPACGYLQPCCQP